MSSRLTQKERRNEERIAVHNYVHFFIQLQDIQNSLRNDWLELESEYYSIFTTNVTEMFNKMEAKLSKRFKKLESILNDVPDHIMESYGISRKTQEKYMNNAHNEAKVILQSCAKATKATRMSYINWTSLGALAGLCIAGWLFAGITGIIVGAVIAGVLYFVLRLLGERGENLYKDLKQKIMNIIDKCKKFMCDGKKVDELADEVYALAKGESTPSKVKKILEPMAEALTTSA